MSRNAVISDVEPSPAEALRRRFAQGWGRMGVAWGVPPATALVHGYLLVNGGPLTGSELQRALDLSDRAVRVALADCEAWGIVERAAEPRRSGARGPAGSAWRAVGDHWEWFRRVVASRKHREADPVIAVIEECLTGADEAAAGDVEVAQIASRLRSLVRFVREFEVAVAAVERADARAVERLFVVLGRLEPATLDRLLGAIRDLPEDDLVRFAETLGSLSPTALRRMLRVAAHPGVGRVVAGRR